jgi:small subunit ribosomal protein S16
MLRIRLSRKGRTHKPMYRIVVSDQKRDTQGRAVENLGHYNPFSKEIVINKERAQYWLSVGAQPSDSVFNIFVSQGVMEAKKRGASSLTKKRSEKIAEKLEAEAAAKAEAEAEATTEEPATEEAAA